MPSDQLFAVLLVEHVEPVALRVWGVLKETGLTNPVKVLRSADQALRYLRQEGKYADTTKYPWPLLVLVDLDLPFNQAFPLLQWLQQSDLEQVIAMPLTSSMSDPRLRMAQELGTRAALLKSASSREAGELLRVASGGQLTFRSWGEEPFMLADEALPH